MQVETPLKLTKEEIKRFSKCLKRELGFRKRVYPKFVAQNKMSETKMNEEIKTMEQMITYFDKLDMITLPEQTRLF